MNSLYGGRRGATDNHDYSRYFTANGTLDVNGLVATGKTEITALYDRAGGGAGEAPPRGNNTAPAGRFNMVMSNLKVAVQGDTATATLLWYSIPEGLLQSRSPDVAQRSLLGLPAHATFGLLSINPGSPYLDSISFHPGYV